jgi:hypothetical protein
MSQTASAPVITSGRDFWQPAGRAAASGNPGAPGLWAGMRLAAAIASGNLNAFSPATLRTLDLLSQREWIAVDTAIVEELTIRLRGVQDLIGMGLVTPITNAMGRTVYEYTQMGDMDPATISMDGMSRGEDDTIEQGFPQMPIPITHKEFFINLRKLAASRNQGEGLDVTQARVSARIVAEALEAMLFQGGPTFGALPLYGYTTHPNRNTGAFGTNGNWVQAAKTGQNILDDILTAKAALEADRFPGPFMVYHSSAYSVILDKDFKSEGDDTIRERILRVEGISGIRSVDTMPANTVVIVQMTPDVVTWGMGEQVQSIMWDVQGGMGINCKTLAIQIPIIRASRAGRSGIFHMS